MRKVMPIVSSLVLLGSLLLIVFEVLAWFTGIYREDVNVDGRVNGGYFAGGNGDEDNPYIIKNEKHLRNLALLQIMESLRLIFIILKLVMRLLAWICLFGSHQLEQKTILLMEFLMVMVK